MQAKLSVLIVMWLLSLSLLSSPVSAQRRLFPTDKIPSSGESINDFVPTGWIIEQQIEGKLTSGPNPDIILSLIEDLPSEVNGVFNERFRALVILERITPGKLRRLAVAATLLRDTQANILGGPDAKPEIRISTGDLEIYQYWGLRWGYEQTLTFRYDPKLQRFVLIEEEHLSVNKDTVQGTRTISNYLTGEQIIEEFNSEENPSKVKKNKFRKSKLFLEDIDYGNE